MFGVEWKFSSVLQTYLATLIGMCVSIWYFVKPSESDEMKKIKAEMFAIYTEHKPENVERINEIVATFRGYVDLFSIYTIARCGF